MKKFKLPFLLMIFFMAIHEQVDSANWSFAKELTTVARYDEEYVGEVSLEILGVELPFGIGASVEVKRNFIGYEKVCDWAFAKCDQDKTGPL